MNERRAGRTIVIGVGHRDRADDAIGPAVVDALARRTDQVVTLVREGDLAVLPLLWEADDDVVVLDAVVDSGPVGELREIDREELRSTPEMSTHGFDVVDAIELARRLHCLPARLRVFGVTARDFGYGPMSGELHHRVERLADELLQELGATPTSSRAHDDDAAHDGRTILGSPGDAVACDDRPMTNTRRVVLVHRPTGQATPDCFRVEDVELDPLEAGQVRVAVEYISVDAGTRTMLRGEGFHMQVGLGETILAGGVGRVIESAADEWEPGQAVAGGFGAQTIATVPAAHLVGIDDSLGPLSLHLGLLGGSTGVTAWIGIREVAKPQPGDDFVVSAAAGAVGSIAGQIAQRDGARVIGIAGGPEKVRHLVDTLGFDAAIDYKNDDVGVRLKELCPGGVNGFFDNVGGSILDAVLDNIAMRARVTICGAVSQYDDMDHITGPSMYLRLAERQSRMEGFAFFHFPDSIGPATRELAQWAADGSIVMSEHVLDGIDRYPEALQFMFEGGNIGKLLVRAG